MEVYDEGAFAGDSGLVRIILGTGMEGINVVETVGIDRFKFVCMCSGEKRTV